MGGDPLRPLSVLKPGRRWLTLRGRTPGGGAEPGRRWLSLPRGRGPSQTPPSRATDSSISPGPPSPWLPALLIERRFYRFCAELAIAKAHPPQGTCMAGTVSAAGGSMQGCRGRSPRRNKLKISPFPGGEERSASAGRGDILPLRGRGARKQAKDRVGGRPTGHAPPRGHHKWQRL